MPKQPLAKNNEVYTSDAIAMQNEMGMEEEKDQGRKKIKGSWNHCFNHGGNQNRGTFIYSKF